MATLVSEMKHPQRNSEDGSTAKRLRDDNIPQVSYASEVEGGLNLDDDFVIARSAYPEFPFPPPPPTSYNLYFFPGL